MLHDQGEEILMFQPCKIDSYFLKFKTKLVLLEILFLIFQL